MWNIEEVKTKLKNNGLSEKESLHLIKLKKQNIIDEKKSKKIKEVLNTLKDSSEEE